MSKKSKKKAGPYQVVLEDGALIVSGPGLKVWNGSVLIPHHLNTAYAAGRSAARKKGAK